MTGSEVPHRAHRPVLAALLAVALLVLLSLGVGSLPGEAAALPAIARHAMQIALPRWGQAEVVSEIVYGSRGFDTFGETFLLLAAVLSVTVLARSKEPRAEYVGESTAGRREQREIDPEQAPDRREAQAQSAERDEDDEEAAPAAPPPDADRMRLAARAPEPAEAMTVVLRVTARIAAVFLAVAAIYLAAWGYSPGGGFPAGAGLAGVVILLYAALGHRRLSGLVRPSVLEPVELGGAVLIVGVGLGGLIAHGSLFANFLPLAAPQTILAGGDEQLYSGAELVEVGTGLVIAVFSLLGLGHDWVPDDDSDRGAQDQ
ncbi:MAG TPA: MnhB domain-containing protein [Jatrophihabitans sp.]|nr:MnhB domain-containing protein [Jatrophihabitans sp.]